MNSAQREMTVAVPVSRACEFRRGFKAVAQTVGRTLSDCMARRQDVGLCALSGSSLRCSAPIVVGGRRMR